MTMRNIAIVVSIALGISVMGTAVIGYVMPPLYIFLIGASLVSGALARWLDE
jgi:hypothetical protein